MAECYRLLIDLFEVLQNKLCIFNFTVRNLQWLSRC